MAPPRRYCEMNISAKSQVAMLHWFSRIVNERKTKEEKNIQVMSAWYLKLRPTPTSNSSSGCGIVVTRQILEICLLFAICIKQTVFGCSSTPGHTRLDLHQTRLRGQSADIQRRLQAMDVWGGSKIRTSKNWKLYMLENFSRLSKYLSLWDITWPTS